MNTQSAAVINWDHLDSLKYRSEESAIANLFARLSLDDPARAAIAAQAADLVRAARQSAARQGMVESFLQQFSLSTPEGLALMGLAEALLRTPDAATRDRLIAEKISAADWAAHLGQSDSLSGQCLDLGADADRPAGRVAG